MQNFSFKIHCPQSRLDFDFDLFLSSFLIILHVSFSKYPKIRIPIEKQIITKIKRLSPEDTGTGLKKIYKLNTKLANPTKLIKTLASLRDVICLMADF